MNRTRTTLVCLAAAVTVLAFAASAHATTFCVNDPACPAGGTPKLTPEAAVVAANADSAFDTIRIGPGTYNTAGFGASMPVEIIGAGRDATKIVQTDGGTALWMSGSGFSSVSKLSVRLTQTGSQGIGLADGADAVDVSVTAPELLSQLYGFTVSGSGSDMNGVKIDLPDDIGVTGIGAAGGGLVRNSTITAATGIAGAGKAVTVRRTAIHARDGLTVTGGPMDASNVLITRHPRPNSIGFVGAEVTNDNAGQDGSLIASNLTIEGGGLSKGYGIYVHSNPNPNVTGGKATATVAGAILHGLTYPMYREGLSISKSATIGIEYSAYPGGASPSIGFGGLFQGAGNLTGNLDPRFVNAAAGDYRLRWDSPLLDKGRPTPLVTDENPDLAGRERVRDSDGNGSAIRDIGAYEYQRLAPSAAIAINPGQALLGSATVFDASQSKDPDGDPLTYAWDFGDGAFGAGAQATHVFGAPGSYAAHVRVTDPTGLQGVAGGTAGVAAAQPGPGGPAGQPGAGGSAGDHVAPVLSNLRLSPKLFTARRGSRVSYRLSEKARLTVVLKRARHRNGRLVFTRYASAGRAAAEGSNAMRLRRRLGSRRLAPGRYRLTLVAVDAAANRSKPLSAKLTIRR